MKILQFPLVKFDICFLIGILLAEFLTISMVSSFVLVSVSLLLLVLSYYLNHPIKKVLFGLLVLISGFSIGLNTVVISNPLLNSNHYTYHQNKRYNQNNIILKIKQRLKNTRKNNRYEAEVTHWNGVESTGSIILNIRKEDKNHTFKIGEILSVSAVYHPTKNPFNPNQFDYGNYLEKQGIYGQLFTEKKKYRSIGFQNSIVAIFANYREELISRLEKSTLDKDVLSIYCALLLGQQQDIDKEIIQDYQFAGAVHILSVSGLHVGLILLFIQFILRPFPNNQKTKNIKLFIIILSLSAFALIAGLAPSVIRAVTMFIFLAIGLHIKRSTNVYHTLLISAFLILLFEPSFIYDIGFQLSYLALFFIVWLQPVLKKIFTPKHKIVSYFWDILTVSFAAQIGTLPLSIYYFHQFPGLFFITNLLVLPLLGVIMAIGIVMLIFVLINYIPELMILILEKSLVVLNRIIHYIASFDTFVIKDIAFSKPLLMSSYITLIIWIIWLKKPRFKTVYNPLIGIILIQIVLLIQKNKIENSSEGIIFSVPKSSMIAERNGKKVIVYSNKNTHLAESDPVIKAYSVGNFSQVEKMTKFKNLLYIHHTKIVIIDSSSVYDSSLKPDLLLLVNSPKINLDRVVSQLNPKVVIADASNYKSYCRLWQTTCIKKNILFHSVHEKGYYVF